MKHSLAALLGCSALIFCMPLRSAAQAGTLDSTFGNSGLVIIDVNNSDEAYSLAVQPDGKILVAGYTSAGSADFLLLRLNVDGTPDNSFGSGGAVQTDFFQNTDYAEEVLQQPDGKIVLAGRARNNTSSGYDFAAARYLPNGTPDSSFGLNGKVSTPVTMSIDWGYSSALQPDGKLLISGYSSADAILVRYNTDGSLDTSFNGSGIVYSGISSGGTDEGWFVLVQPDGKILTGGRTWDSISNYSAFGIARHHSDGSLDTAFGAGGKVVTNIGSGDDIAYDAALQPDGKVILAGYAAAWNNSSANAALVRYNTDGSLDNTFGNGGMITFPIGANPYAAMHTITLQPDGKIVVGGKSGPTANMDACLVRLLGNGTIDTTFNGFGIVGLPLDASDDAVFATFLQADGKLLAAGMTTVTANAEVDLFVARCLSDLNMGAVDFSAQDNSVYVYPNPVAAEATLAYTLLQDEKISVYVTDALGKIVCTPLGVEMQSAGVHHQPLLLPGELASGTYFIVLSSARGKVSVKFVK